MSGIAQAALSASESVISYTVTVAALLDVSGNNIGNGFISGSGGAVSGSTFRGLTITEVAYISLGGSFNIQLTGSVNKTHLRRVRVQAANGTFQNLSVHSASFDNSGGNSRWTWTASNVWVLNGTDRSLTITY
jgi:hypothetical protein